MNFTERLQIAKEFSDQCRNYFASQNLAVREWGEQDTLDGLPLASRMKMPKEIRYQPDFAVMGKWHLFNAKWFGVDAKSGSERDYCTIEKNAYTVYMNIDVAVPVLIITDRPIHDRKRWVSFCRVSKLVFQDSQSIVRRFQYDGCNAYPIDGDGWIVPPRSSKAASGTPYKAVDSRCFTRICEAAEWKSYY